MNKRINLAPLSFEEVYADCLSTTRRNRDEYVEYSAFVFEKQCEYLVSGKFGGFEDFDDFYLDEDSHDEFKGNMIWLYDNKFSKIDSVGRKFYDKVLSSAKSSLCPYCLQHDVSQLDHFLPKSNSPSLAVTPKNLVPSCSMCNSSKNNSRDLFINPHFEVVDDEVYLKCAIIFEDGHFIFDYTLDKPSSWNDDLFSRLRNQLLNADYSALYSMHAIQHLGSEQLNFKRVFTRHGKDELLDHLQTSLFGTENTVGINHWKSSYYRAWIEYVKVTNNPFWIEE